MWTYDSIMRGWRYSVVVNECLYRTASYCTQLEAPQFDLELQLKRKQEGKSTRFVQTGVAEYTLPAGR